MCWGALHSVKEVLLCRHAGAWPRWLKFSYEPCCRTVCTQTRGWQMHHVCYGTHGPSSSAFNKERCGTGCI